MRKLLIFWWLFALGLLAAGILSIVYPVIIRNGSDIIVKMVLSERSRNIGVALGVTLLASFILAMAAITRPVRKTHLLIALNWTLVVNMSILVGVGTYMWFKSLTIREYTGTKWKRLSRAEQAYLQDKYSCCGYYNGTLAGMLMANTGYCSVLQTARVQTGCINQLSSRTQFALENIYTSLYAFVAVTASLFLATVCVINERRVEIRFAKIEMKRGGQRGLV